MTFSIAWKATKPMCPEFEQLVNGVSDVRSSIKRNNNIQLQLLKTIKKSSGTRPKRSYDLVYHSGKAIFMHNNTIFISN